MSKASSEFRACRRKVYRSHNIDRAGHSRIFFAFVKARQCGTVENPVGPNRFDYFAHDCCVAKVTANDTCCRTGWAATMNRGDNFPIRQRCRAENIRPQKAGRTGNEKHGQTGEVDTDPIMSSSCWTVSHSLFVSLLYRNPSAHGWPPCFSMYCLADQFLAVGRIA